MNQKIVINSSTELWEFVFHDENKFMVIGDDITIDEAAKGLNCSPELLKTVGDSLRYLRDCILEDLNDLYIRTTK